ncbi:cytidine deaminase [Salinisphaera sp.]|uniref:cytidine deaminase n=1 Tax=Salinisphaera sp. TaxID=1914330 RepID=UPI002D794E29|nr:cytidine deaminase [Salinisphaera sp.]HET7314911.1 cytidine deaminase [Salinisphaera sp.]
MATIDTSVWERLVAAAVKARAHAYAPYSKFPVGAAIRVEGGHIAVGCNVENVSFPCGQCAEAGAVANLAVTHGRRSIQAVVVIGASDRFTWPCGQCRQILAEFAPPDAMVMSVAGDRWSDPVRLDELLPHAFKAVE